MLHIHLLLKDLWRLTPCMTAQGDIDHISRTSAKRSRGELLPRAACSKLLSMVENVPMPSMASLEARKCMGQAGHACDSKCTFHECAGASTPITTSMTDHKCAALSYPKSEHSQEMVLNYSSINLNAKNLCDAAQGCHDPSNHLDPSQSSQIMSYLLL